MRLFKPPTSKARDRWESMKAQGKWKFILRVGVLQWGGVMFVIMTALDLWRKPPYPRQPIDVIATIVINLAVWPLAGCIFGLLTWAFNNSRFSGGHSADR